jgi:hypothetical protein
VTLTVALPVPDVDEKESQSIVPSNSHEVSTLVIFSDSVPPDEEKSKSVLLERYLGTSIGVLLPLLSAYSSEHPENRLHTANNM